MKLLENLSLALATLKGGFAALAGGLTDIKDNMLEGARSLTAPREDTGAPTFRQAIDSELKPLKSELSHFGDILLGRPVPTVREQAEQIVRARHARKNG